MFNMRTLNIGWIDQTQQNWTRWTTTRISFCSCSLLVARLFDFFETIWVEIIYDAISSHPTALAPISVNRTCRLEPKANPPTYPSSTSTHFASRFIAWNQLCFRHLPILPDGNRILMRCNRPTNKKTKTRTWTKLIYLISSMIAFLANSKNLNANQMCAEDACCRM